MLVVIWSLLYASCSASALPGHSLRGAPEDVRKLQSAALLDPTPRFGVPQCGPGYVDTTAGNAYYPWSCAGSCAGGIFWATKDCNCACARQDQEHSPSPPRPSGVGSGSSNPVGPVTTQRPRTTRNYIAVQQDPPSYIVPSPSTTKAPAAKEASGSVEGGRGGNGAVVAATVVSVGLLVCGVAACIWVSTVPQKSMPHLHVAEVPAVTVHAPAEHCPQPVDAGKPPRPRTSSKMSTDSQVSDRSLISGSRISSRTSCPSEQSQNSGQFTKTWEGPTASTTSSALRPTIVNATLWAHRVDAADTPGQLAAEGSRGSSKLSRVEPENGSSSRRSSKSRQSSKTSAIAPIRSSS